MFRPKRFVSKKIDTLLQLLASETKSEEPLAQIHLEMLISMQYDALITLMQSEAVYHDLLVAYEKNSVTLREAIQCYQAQAAHYEAMTQSFLQSLLLAIFEKKLHHNIVYFEVPLEEDASDVF